MGSDSATVSSSVSLSSTTPTTSTPTPSTPTTSTPTTSPPTATSSSRLLELLAVSPTIPTTTKPLHITERRNLNELEEESSNCITGQIFSTSPKSIPSSPSDPAGDEEVITLRSRSPSPTSTCSSPSKSPTSKAKTSPLPQFRVVSKERKATAKLSPKHLWLDTREEGNPKQPERPPVNSVHDQSYLTPMEDDDLDDLDSLDRVLAPSQSGSKRGNDPKPPEKVECPYCKRFYGKYYINKHMVDQHP